jgi:hypothetical protein
LLTVILTVLPAGSTLGPQVYPTGLIFTGVAGVTPGKQDVLVGNPTGQPNSFLSGQIGSGFTFVPPVATIQPSQPQTVHVYPDFSKITPGTISRGTTTLQFTDGSPSQTVNILFVVAPLRRKRQRQQFDRRRLRCLRLAKPASAVPLAGIVPSGITPSDSVPVVLTIAGQTSPP